MAYRPIMVAFDLETTGLSPAEAEIIELAAVQIEGSQITRHFQSLVRSSKPIPLNIERLTGITQEMLEPAPALSEVLPIFLDFVGNYPLIAHQAVFDVGFLEYSLGQKIQNEVLDTVELARLAFPRAANHKLLTLARELNLPLTEAHRALADARITAQLFLAIDQVLKGWPPGMLRRFNELAATFDWPLTGYFRYLEQYVIKHSFALPKRENAHFLAPVPAAARGIFALAKETRENDPNQFQPVDRERLKHLLLPEGGAAGCFGFYEHRPQQIAMLEQVAEAFNQDRHLLVEAGTGTGKSLAYLLPAVVSAVQNQDKVVVSTHTITLQEQLWLKDIPQLKEALQAVEEKTGSLVAGGTNTGSTDSQVAEKTNAGERAADFKTALVKGRGNYLCLRKWNAVTDLPDPYPAEEKRFFLRLMAWLSQTETGDRTELNLHQKALEDWYLVAADSESCLGSKCPWYNHWCFVQRARRQCVDAHLLVVNHSLLLSDLRTDNQVLPDYSRLIIDEAHHLEDAATENLGFQISLQGLISLGNGLYRQTRHGPTGLLVNLKNRLNRLKLQRPDLSLESAENDMAEMLRAISQVKEQAETFFGIIMAIASNDSESAASFGRNTYRLRPALTAAPWWEGWLGTKDNLLFYLKSLTGSLSSLDSFLEMLEIEFGHWLSEKKDLDARRQFYLQFMEGLQFITALSEENWVYWVEMEQRADNHNCLLRAAPIEVAELLNQYLFIPKKTVILTSATMAVGDSFKHFMDRTGLNQVPTERVEVMQLESPFLYEEQALLCVVRDLPNPALAGDKLYIESITPVLAELLATTQGRAMVLFTSHYMLRETYFRLKPLLESQAINLLGHGIDGSQSRLMEEFRATPASVIFGASTFWEGVDIQGEDLSCVIIVKLPFLPPNQPIVEARLEAITRKNRNGFYNYTLPEAILRLKQGFGRLIRAQSDRGIVIILDNRIVDKSYGHWFFRSLPINTHLRANLYSIKERIQNWLTTEPLA